jgi:hypothetical protein
MLSSETARKQREEERARETGGQAIRRDGALSAWVEWWLERMGGEEDGGEEAPCYAFVVTDVRRRFDVDFKEAKTGYSTSESCLAGSSKNRAGRPCHSC